MKSILNSRVAIVRALASGRSVWCAETGEGWQHEGGCSLNQARRVVRWIFILTGENKTFFTRGD